MSRLRLLFPIRHSSGNLSGRRRDRRIVIRIFLFFLLALPAGAQLLPDSPNTPAPPALLRPWENITIRIVAPGTAGPPPVAGPSTNAPAQVGIYRFSSPKGVRGHATLSVVAFHDPLTQASYVFPSDVSWFLVGNNTLTGLTEAYSSCFFSTPYVALPDASGNLSAAIARFESTWTAPQILDALSNRLLHRVSFQSALPPAFYGTEHQTPAAAHNPVPAANVRLANATLTGTTLQLTVINTPTKQTATILINLATHQLISPAPKTTPAPTH